jgi:hypothetical protein
MKLRALLTASATVALAVGAFAAPGLAAASAGGPASIAAPAVAQPRLTVANLQNATGAIAVGKPAGLIPGRNSQLGTAPTVRAAGAAPQAACSAEPNCNMSYHGGRVQHHPRVYIVFWGPKWSHTSKGDTTHHQAENYLVSFYKGLGLAPTDDWSRIERQYGDKTGFPIIGKSLFAGSHIDPRNPGKVTLDGLAAEAATAATSFFSISMAAANNVEIVIASQSGTCFAPAGFNGPVFVGNCGKEQSNPGYCAFHSFDFSTKNKNVFLPWVNLPFQLDAHQECGQDFVNTTEPSGHFDGFSVTGGHETAETITDPEESAWFDSNDECIGNCSGGEIADKCAWGGVAWNQFPADPSGNLTFAGKNYAAQSLWSNVTRRCVMAGTLPFKVIPRPNQTGTTGTAVSLKVFAATTPKAPLTFTAAGLPSGLTIGRANGLISGKPGVTAGTFNVKVIVSYYDAARSFTFTWQVSSPPGRIQGPAAKCVDDAGAHTTNGNKIDIFTCTGKPQQVITFAANGELMVLGKCITGGSTVSLQPCIGATSQIWTRHANREYSLRLNGKCLTDPGGSTANGTRLTLAACKNTTSQHWSLP